MGPPLANTVVTVGALQRSSLDEATVVLQFERLPLATSLTVEFSGGTGFSSDFGGQEHVNSLVLEVQELRFVNLEFCLTTYVRRSKVTESSWSEISKQEVDSSNSTIGVSYINQETLLRHFGPANSGRSTSSSSLLFGSLLVKNA